MKTIKEYVNQGFNLLGVSIVSLSGFAFMPEIFLENDPVDKGDDIALLVLGIIAMLWYSKGGNKYKRSVAPVVFVVLALITKIVAIAIEFQDKDAIGDDFGALILFVLSTALVLYRYFKTKKILAEAV